MADQGCDQSAAVKGEDLMGSPPYKSDFSIIGRLEPGSEPVAVGRRRKNLLCFRLKAAYAPHILPEYVTLYPSLVIVGYVLKSASTALVIVGAGCRYPVR
jgi:hypothetical protein